MQNSIPAGQNSTLLLCEVNVNIYDYKDRMFHPLSLCLNKLMPIKYYVWAIGYMKRNSF